MKCLKLGSLFDGSGGFPLASVLSGIVPVWASEIEPFPIRVTTKRFPFMKHYGDIRRINGAAVSPVDVITFGSPCQDLSLAGKRAGLKGFRSSLFHEAIRVIKEMREATHGVYPRFIVWENVLGAFSSNKGEDFRTVLEEICRAKNGRASIPKPEKWRHAGCIMGNGYSVAWRVLDAQYWGVPQRRNRIFLVADFNGQCAGKVLFESEGLSRYSRQGFKAWQKTASSAGKSSEDTSSLDGIDLLKKLPLLLFENYGSDNRLKGPIRICPTICARLGTGGNNQPLVMKNIYGICSESSNSMKSSNSYSGIYPAAMSRTLNLNGGNPNCNTVLSASRADYFTRSFSDLAGALVATDYKDPPIVSRDYSVRRLTPKECGLLQGFPASWCDALETDTPTKSEIAFWENVFETRRQITGQKRSKTRKQIIKWLKNPYSDSAEYKLWGNGVALPCVWFILAGIVHFAE